MATGYEIEKFAFDRRLCNPSKLGAQKRPVNPFAVLGVKNRSTLNAEVAVRSGVANKHMLGAQYKDKYVETTSDDSITLDTYSVVQNPNAVNRLHTTRRLDVEHTREK